MVEDIKEGIRDRDSVSLPSWVIRAIQRFDGPSGVRSPRLGCVYVFAPPVRLPQSRSGACAIHAHI